MAPSEQKAPISTGLTVYVVLLALASAWPTFLSVSYLLNQAPEYRTQLLTLVALTVVSGLLPVRLPTISATISVSETFIIAGTLLFGPSGGTILVLLDGLAISIRLLFAIGLRWQQVLFNISFLPFSVWITSSLVGLEPRFQTEGSLGFPFILQLTIFTTTHCVLSTWLLAIALGMQSRTSALKVWSSHFRELLVSYASGGSIAALLVYNTREVQAPFVFAIVPLLIVLSLAFKWSNKRIEIERERNAELNRVFLSTVEALALAIDAKDQVTHGHIRRVQRYTMALARALGVKDGRELDAIRAAALLHDTGKLAVPEYILNKPGPLTQAEFERMKVHATVGADILKSIDFPYPVEPIVRHHHENWNGTGYPARLKGQEIPVGARILSVVDCYDALTSDRPYRPRYTRENAVQVLKERRGTWYDPWVIDGFLAILDQLEREDLATEADRKSELPTNAVAPADLEVITATTAEEREFSELRRDLPLADSATSAVEVLFRHLRRVTPAANLTVFAPAENASELEVVGTFGVGTSAIEGLHIAIGERVSGWAVAHRQAVINSTAAIDLGPVSKTFSTPLRYALAVPIFSTSQSVIGAITCYASEPFNPDHVRIVESAATLFAQSRPGGVGFVGKSSGIPKQPTTSVH